MIAFLRSNGISGDSRVGKYIDFYVNQKLSYHIIGWDRLAENLSFPNCTFYKKQIGYNIGGIKAVIGRLGWFYFIFIKLLKLKPSTIHACDLDCAFPAAIYKCFYPNTVLIFDVFDWFSATLYNQAAWIRLIFSALEKFTIKKSNHVIICEPERRNQIPYDIDDKVSILPNIPLIDDNEEIIPIEIGFSNNFPKIAYVGAFYKERFLDELIQLAKNKKINLLFAGYGDSEITANIQTIRNQDNVRFFGKVEYKKGLSIMKAADAIYAMYCTSNPNNVCAAPNKFYEALFLGKPIITTSGTTIGEKVEKHDIGFVIREDIDELNDLICQLKNQGSTKLKYYGQRASDLWKTTYRTFVANYLITTYRALIK